MDLVDFFHFVRISFRYFAIRYFFIDTSYETNYLFVTFFIYLFILFNSFIYFI